MQLKLDASIEIFGIKVEPFADIQDTNGHHHYYYFDKADRPITISTQLFKDSGSIAYIVVQGKFSMEQMRTINMAEHQVVFGPLVQLEEFPFELDESVREIINPEFVSHTDRNNLLGRLSRFFKR